MGEREAPRSRPRDLSPSLLRNRPLRVTRERPQPGEEVSPGELAIDAKPGLPEHGIGQRGAFREIEMEPDSTLKVVHQNQLTCLVGDGHVHHQTRMRGHPVSEALDDRPRRRRIEAEIVGSDDEPRASVNSTVH